MTEGSVEKVPNHHREPLLLNNNLYIYVYIYTHCTLCRLIWYQKSTYVDSCITTPRFLYLEGSLCYDVSSRAGLHGTILTHTFQFKVRFFCKSLNVYTNLYIPSFCINLFIQKNFFNCNPQSKYHSKKSAI